MTPEGRAEVAIDGAVEAGAFGYGGIEKEGVLKSLIAAAIREAEEAVREQCAKTAESADAFDPRDPEVIAKAIREGKS